MDFELEFIFLSLVFSCFSKCHSRIQKYPYTSSVFTEDEYFSGLGYFWDFPTTTLDDLGLEYQPASLEDDVYIKIFENQFLAYSIISELENNLPWELRNSRTSFYSDVLPKNIYFEDYPHIKAVLQHQWKRLKNSLDGNRLGSLRVDSPFYRS